MSAATPGLRPLARAKGAGRRSPMAAAGLLLLGAFAMLSILHPWLMPYDPVAADASAVLQAPSAVHWFGTDANGMDVFSRVIYGAIYAFGIAFPAVAVAMLIGVPVGLLTGYLGGWADEVLMRGFDAMRVFPSIILALAVVAAAGPSLFNVVIVLGVLDAPVFARLVRAETLSLKARDFTRAARALGARPGRIMFRHILPNAAGSLVVATTMSVGALILFESTLSFLGLGTQPPAASWGNMLTGAQELLQQAPMLALWPGLLIFLTVIAFNFVGDGLQDALDPRSERR